MEIVMHDYQDFKFGQLAIDTQLGKQLVPKGYVNVTAMCKGHGKKFTNYMRTEAAREYLKELSLDARIPAPRLAITVSGSPGGNSSLQGVWVHPEVAVDVAAWISPKFKVWANRTLRLVIANQFSPQTADAAIAQSQLKQEYSHVLDRPDPWKKLFDQEFCKQIYALGGPGFYWEFCYHWLTPTERCEIELKNPVLNGRRHDRIHQFFSEETKLRLKPYLAELAAVVATANGDKKAFWTGYRKHFKGINQLDIPFPPLD